MFVCVLCAFFLFLHSHRWDSTSRPKKRLMSNYLWISLFKSYTYTVSNLAYRIWVILIANKSVGGFHERIPQKS
jgi:hypothetical protein